MSPLLLPPMLALALLAAHFYRASAWPLLALCVLLLALMLVLRRAWVPRMLQVGLLAGSLEWLWTTFLLAQQRMALGQPWLRMTLILCAVAAFTAAAALVFRSAGLRNRYGVR